MKLETEKELMTDERPFDPLGRRLAVGIASLAYVGFFPFAPGTLATLMIAVPCAILLAQFHWVVYAGATAVIFAVSCLTAGRAGRAFGVPDSRKVVIDELAGYLVAMFMIPVNWKTVAFSFILFRFFDVVKPWPVCWADRKVHGGIGVTLDDVLAGGYVLALGHILLALWPALLGRL